MGSKNKRITSDKDNNKFGLCYLISIIIIVVALFLILHFLKAMDNVNPGVNGLGNLGKIVYYFLIILTTIIAMFSLTMIWLSNEDKHFENKNFIPETNKNKQKSKKRKKEN